MSLRLTSGTLGAVLAFCLVALPAGAEDVVSQSELARRLEDVRPEERAFVKDQPILGWRLDVASVDDLPDVIREHLGAVDDTGYDGDYLEKNRGSIVALQMTEEGPDFYVIGKDTYETSYEEVPLAEVAEKNDALVGRLATLPELRERFESSDPGLVGARKTEPVAMTRLSDLGYEVARELTIASPWGTQTKPAGQDGYLVRTGEGDQVYLVNVDEKGLPIGYVPVE